jgi:uncharacterized protein DUF3536/glycosyl hydrolase family 57
MERGIRDALFPRPLTRESLPLLPSLVIHGHFYQPPRENPFLDEVEAEPSAAPYHDWNQRIERECYRAVVAARITDATGRIARVVNTLEWISFNIGPTLLEWLEREAENTYHAILAADRASADRLGHGNAIAQPYHHTILPLASRRDKVTEVRWGIADFRRRYGRDPAGMWLPETAVDDETLDVLASEGIAFTILAPHQVVRVPPQGRPGRYRTTSGRSIALCLYDGALSHGIAFGGLLHDAAAWVRRMEALGAELGRGGQREPDLKPRRKTPAAAATVPEGAGRDGDKSEVLPSSHSGVQPDSEILLSAATDGETYGHHHKFGEMALARAIDEMRRRQWLIENFASYVARVQPRDDVQLVSPTSWSCAHGVERWRSDCGCRLNAERYPTQAWRTPLRGGLERLADGLHDRFAREGADLFEDVWGVRDAFGAVVGGPPDRLAGFARTHATRARTPDDLVRARELLEMERDALRMFTSCAWFFDDIGGLEPRQILRYAARAIGLAGDDGPRLERMLLEDLTDARSNDPEVGTGADVYRRVAQPSPPYRVRIAAAAIAGVHVSAHVGAHVPAWVGEAVELHGDSVRVTEPRTGRVHTFHATVRAKTSTDVITEVEREDGSRDTLHLADLPERQRHAIRSRLRRTILPRCLTQDELDLLVAGDVTLAGLVRVALLRTVEQLEHDHNVEVVQLVNDLLDLIDQFEARIPFDTQTTFWRIWNAALPNRRAQLLALHARMGFTDPATDA